METEKIFTIKIHRRAANNILKGLIAFEIFLLVAYVFMNIVFTPAWARQISVFFDLDSEFSLPTWFSSIQLFIFSLLLFVISRSAKKYAWFYALGAAIICFLSIDEFSSIHERISLAAKENDIGILKSLMIADSGAWIVPYAAIALIVISLSVKPIIYIYHQYTRAFLFVFSGLLIFFVGVIGVEIISYGAGDASELVYSFIIATEEFCEMLGISVAFYGMLLLGIELQPTASNSGSLT